MPCKLLTVKIKIQQMHKCKIKHSSSLAINLKNTKQNLLNLTEIWQIHLLYDENEPMTGQWFEHLNEKQQNALIVILLCPIFWESFQDVGTRLQGLFLFTRASVRSDTHIGWWDLAQTQCSNLFQRFLMRSALGFEQARQLFFQTKLSKHFLYGICFVHRGFSVIEKLHSIKWHNFTKWQYKAHQSILCDGLNYARRYTCGLHKLFYHPHAR